MPVTFPLGWARLATSKPAGREVVKISVTIVSQRLPAPRPSEYPAIQARPLGDGA
jgi:hypothetical protein